MYEVLRIKVGGVRTYHHIIVTGIRLEGQTEKYECFCNEFQQKFPHFYRASWYYQSFIYSPTDALVGWLKKRY